MTIVLCVLQFLIIQLDNAEHIKIHLYYYYTAAVSLKHIIYNEYSRKMPPNYESVSLGKHLSASK